jgi:polyhydroxyalkanoate synthase
MGGTMSSMYTALYPEQIRNLILMAAPIDFSGDDGLLNLWTQEQYFDVDAFVDAFGNCPGSFLQSSFQLMKPVQNFVEKYNGFVEKMDDDAFLENFFAMERWGNDNIPVAGETFREFVKYLYQRNQLVLGEFQLGDVPVKLQNISCPLLTLVAEHDHLVPANSTLAIKHYVSSKYIHNMSINAGHIGLAVSSKGHSQLWPDAAMWIADHSTNRP